MVSMIGDKYNALNDLGSTAGNPNIRTTDFALRVVDKFDIVCDAIKAKLRHREGPER